MVDEVKSCGSNERFEEEPGRERSDDQESELFKSFSRELWETRVRVMEEHEARKSGQPPTYPELRVVEGEIIPLDACTGFQRVVVDSFSEHILYAVSAVVYSRIEHAERTNMLRLADDFNVKDSVGGLHELADDLDVTIGRDRVRLSFPDYRPVYLWYVEVEGRKYLELGSTDLQCVAAAAFLSNSTGSFEPFYNLLVDFVCRILPFNIGEVELAGYDELVERCNNLLCYESPLVMKRNILLAGPPGCGKSMILKQLARMHPEYVRCSLTRARNWLYWVDVFTKVLKRCSRRILLVIDEVEEFGLSRDREGDSVYPLLRLMDGAEDARSLILLASTNRPEDLDSALLRPGRFGPVIWVRKPALEQKKAIISFYGERYGATLDAEEIANEVNGDYSGADIRISVEDCLFQGIPVTTENVIANLRGIVEDARCMAVYREGVDAHVM